MDVVRTKRREKVKSEASAKTADLAQSPKRQPSPKARDLLFSRSEASLYCSLATLPQRAGVPASLLPHLVVKELCDNGLDAADAAGRPGAVKISITRRGDLIVADQGTITGSTSIKPAIGLKLIAIAGDQPFVSEHLSWALNAIELAQQSGRPARAHGSKHCSPRRGRRDDGRRRSEDYPTLFADAAESAAGCDPTAM